MSLRPGDPIPDLVLGGTDGSDVSLRGLGGEETLLVFLRHLA